ncbi:uncharacterized protein SOCE26_080790 [Sorangium cellulosum]|uniref:Uncharacterized protein n=1 Tax=Sorangium cellulosum TaxID=56 RepID=A0A2L0F4V2_SORCE|nr:PD40 domain-containing protein [Sorangium cellulosum]AUX46573.1 uncharacterized protein SOCE26_080790 [Sorangium cellulosum]
MGVLLTMAMCLSDLAAKVRALREAAAARASDDRLAAALVRQPGAHAANAIAFLGGALLVAASAYAVLFAVALAILDGRESGLPRLGGLCAVEIGLCLALIAAVRWLLADRRALRLLTLNFAALAPARAGDPPACRACAGPLPEPAAGAAMARCVYCGAPNVLAADLRVEAGLLQRLGAHLRDPHDLLVAHARRRRRAGLLGALGAALAAAGALWLAVDQEPAGDAAVAAAIPFARQPEQAQAVGPLQVGPGAAAVERVATLEEEVVALLPDGRGGVDVIVIGGGSRLVRAPRGEVPRGSGERLAGEEIRVWAREPGGEALLFADGEGVRRRAPDGSVRALYGPARGRWLDDRLVVGLEPGAGGRVLMTSRASDQGHYRVRALAPDGDAPILLHDARAPALHPDGRTLAVERLVGELHFHVALVQQDAASPRLLTRGEGDTTLPAWSPDGGRIAFLAGTALDPIRRDEPHGEVHLWAVDPEGRAAQLTRAGEVVPLRPVWTEAGIYVVVREGDARRAGVALWRVKPR